MTIGDSQIVPVEFKWNGGQRSTPILIGPFGYGSIQVMAAGLAGNLSWKTANYKVEELHRTNPADGNPWDPTINGFEFVDPQKLDNSGPVASLAITPSTGPPLWADLFAWNWLVIESSVVQPTAQGAALRLHFKR